MIAYVNGYVCTTSCEAAAARAGRDPFAPPGTPPGQSGKSDKADKSSGLDSQPATVFGGSLANLNSDQLGHADRRHVVATQSTVSEHPGVRPAAVGTRDFRMLNADA